MKSMKLNAVEATKEASYDSPSDKPEYPYGLTISLDDQSLSNLGMNEMPEIGTIMTLEAKVIVCSKSQYQNQDGPDNNLSLQITDMALTEDADEPKDERTAAQKIYGKK
jgi:hypothetical protein